MLALHLKLSLFWFPKPLLELEEELQAETRSLPRFHHNNEPIANNDWIDTNALQMLDLTKIARQIPGISQHLTVEAAASRQRLELAQTLLLQTHARQEELVKRQQQWRDRMTFTAATPVEPLDTRVDLSTAPESHTIFATDGSHIAPSHHEIAYCYLINVGRVMLHYGQSLYPLLDSLPEVFYRPEDLYVSRQWGIRTEEWMGHRRTVSEATMLAEMACRWVNPPGPHFDTPNLAMVDGSLIYWFLEGLPGDARDRIWLYCYR